MFLHTCLFKDNIKTLKQETPLYINIVKLDLFRTQLL